MRCSLGVTGLFRKCQMLKIWFQGRDEEGGYRSQSLFQLVWREVTKGGPSQFGGAGQFYSFQRV